MEWRGLVVPGRAAGRKCNMHGAKRSGGAVEWKACVEQGVIKETILYDKPAGSGERCAYGCI